MTAEAALKRETFSPPVYPEQTVKVLQQLAADSLWLLKGTESVAIDPPTIRERYRCLLAERGLATHSGRIREGKLLAAFQKYFPDRVLQFLRCPLGSTVENWLIRLLRESNEAVHPLYHLLLLQFLETTAEAFFNQDLEVSPFGKAPWYCLNTLCNDYKQPVIFECQLAFSKDSGRPIGQFCCPTCQFTYSRLGPDKSEADLYRRSYIVSFGSTWERTLQNNWLNPGVSLRQLAQMLGVDPRTVKRQAQQLHLLPSRPGATSKEVIGTMSSAHVGTRPPELVEQRQLWLKAAESNPELGKTELRRSFPALYGWLYRNDKTWLQQNSPKSKRAAHINSRQVDWCLRDMTIANACLRAAIELLVSSKRPVQLTRTGVARNGDYLAVIEKHSSKLPLTDGLIGRVVESRTQFAIRRIWEAANRRKQTEHTKVARWQLIRESATSRVADWPEVSAAIDQVITVLTNSEAFQGKIVSKPLGRMCQELTRLMAVMIVTNRLETELRDG